MNNCPACGEGLIRTESYCDDCGTLLQTPEIIQMNSLRAENAALKAENERLENQVMARDAELWGRTQEILSLKAKLELAEACLAGDNALIAGLKAEIHRLAGEVANRNKRALEGDQHKKAFDDMYDKYEALREELATLKADLAKAKIAKANLQAIVDSQHAVICDELKSQEPVAIHQWRTTRGDRRWHDASKEEAYSRVDADYEARTLFSAPQPAADDYMRGRIDGINALSTINEVFEPQQPAAVPDVWTAMGIALATTPEAPQPAAVQWEHARFVQRVLEAGNAATEKDRADAYWMIKAFRQMAHEVAVSETKLPAAVPDGWNAVQVATWIGNKLMHEPSMFERKEVCRFVRSLGRHPDLVKHFAAPEAPQASAEAKNAERYRKLRAIAFDPSKGLEAFVAVSQLDHMRTTEEFDAVVDQLKESK